MQSKDQIKLLRKKGKVCASCNSIDNVKFRGNEYNEYGTFYIGYPLCEDCNIVEHRIFADNKESEVNDV
mgnify:CR=1 FL=1